MTKFSSLISKFAHDDQASPSSSTIRIGTGTNEKKPSLKGNNPQESDLKDESSTTDMKPSPNQQVNIASASRGPSNSRVVSADSIKTRLRYKESVVKDISGQWESFVKEETTVKKVVETTRVKTQGRNPGYAPPSVYAHLPLLPDIIDYDLDVLFVGINPGVQSSSRSHHFANPTNHFWPCLSDSGLLPPGVRLGPNDDHLLPSIANMGLTNLVDRPSRMGNELSEAECRASVPTLMAKIKKYRPRFVCFVSKQAWEMFTGIGLGLQTGWVGWDDEEEDEILQSDNEMNIPKKEEEGEDEVLKKEEDTDVLMKTENNQDDDDEEEETKPKKEEDDSEPRKRTFRTVQDEIESTGYRISPYLEDGPAIKKLKGDLAREGTPSPLIKREPSLSDGLLRIKKEEEEDKKEQKAKTDIPAVVRHHRNGAKTTTKTTEAAAAAAATTSKRGYVRGSRMFVMPSTSGRVTQYKREDKLAYLQQLSELVRKDRKLRGL